MKNKILATLLSVCLFAGLAVPAFAAVDVTTSPLTAAAEDGKTIVTTKSSLTIENGGTENLLDYVTLLVDKNLAADPSLLQWDIEGDDDGAFVNNGESYTAIADKGTAYAVVSTEDGKESIKIKLTAKPAARDIVATGFRFKDNAYSLQGGINGGAAPYADSVIKLAATPSGAKFSDTQKAKFDAIVAVWDDQDAFFKSDAGITLGNLVGALAEGNKEYHITFTAANMGAVEPSGTTPTAGLAWGDAANAAFENTTVTKVTDYNTLKIAMTDFPLANGTNTTRTSSTKVKVVAPKDFAAVRNNGTLTIKVGETKDLDDWTKVIPTDTNAADTARSYFFDYYNSAADEMDFAAINGDNVIKGVKVGKFKVTATAENEAGDTLSTTFTVNVIPWSATAETTDSEVKLANSVGNTMVGGTFKMTVNGAAADAAITYGSLNETIATVDAEGNVKGIAAGTTKVWASVDGGEKLYCEVTVKAGSTNGSTNVPQTGFVSLVSLF